MDSAPLTNTPRSHVSRLLHELNSTMMGHPGRYYIQGIYLSLVVWTKSDKTIATFSNMGLMMLRDITQIATILRSSPPLSNV